jgi:hypothetical protein
MHYVKTHMELVLRPNKTKTLFVASFWALLSVLCLYLTNADSRVMGFVIFSGAISLFYAVKICPGVTYLKLTHQGFEYKYVLPARFIAWNHVGNFTTYYDKGRLFAGWNYKEGFLNRSLMHRITKMRWRVDDSFMENFQHYPTSLARLLEDWRQEHSEVPQSFVLFTKNHL